MGKKSRRRGKSSKGKGGLASSSNANMQQITKKADSHAPPSGAFCWICLEEGIDDLGKPLVRDCSCRGVSGFAHLGCTIKYAQQKSEDSSKNDKIEFSEAWTDCPNCNQRYRNKLFMDLVNALITYTKSNYPCKPSIKCLDFPCEPMRYIEAMFVKLMALQETDTEVNLGLWKNAAMDGMAVASEIISVISKMKENCALIFGSSPIDETVINLEAHVYDQLGMINLKDALLEDRSYRSKPNVKYFQKYKEMSESIGDTISVSDAEYKIQQWKDFFGNSKEGSSFSRGWTSVLRKKYKQDSDIETGRRLATSLMDERHGIECRRLVAELIIKSLRIHGPDHDTTRDLQSLQETLTFVIVNWKNEWYQAVRCEDDGDKYVLKGPISSPQGLGIISKGDNTHVISAHEAVIGYPGTPVICHGLTNATHLNEKIGDIRGIDVKTKQCEIHFEDTNLKPCLVKQKNLRILFELPEN
mmetsp:Transcript_14343/g.25661  ORF Transcript_14343/g.25661 Transcript_14343/m.25661 type:complete len:471 (+) Transcript_14343:281-1693(+)